MRAKVNIKIWGFPKTVSDIESMYRQDILGLRWEMSIRNRKEGGERGW